MADHGTAGSLGGPRRSRRSASKRNFADLVANEAGYDDEGGDSTSGGDMGSAADRPGSGSASVQRRRDSSDGAAMARQRVAGRVKQNITRPARHFPWTEEENDRLRAAIATHGARDWRRIADEVGTGRTADQCCQHWVRALSPDIRKGRWTAQEVALLEERVRLYGTSAWKQVAMGIPGRTGVQARTRWFRPNRHDDLGDGSAPAAPAVQRRRTDQTKFHHYQPNPPLSDNAAVPTALPSPASPSAARQLLDLHALPQPASLPPPPLQPPALGQPPSPLPPPPQQQQQRAGPAPGKRGASSDPMSLANLLN